MSLVSRPWAPTDRPVPRWFVRANCVCAWGIAIASYWGANRPATNDFERFDHLWLSYLFFLLFAGWSTAYLAYATRLLQQPPVSLSGKALVLPLASVMVPLLVSFPVGSRDVFAYVFYGKMWGQYGANPYLHAPSEFVHDRWYELLQAWWKEGVAGYGPLFILQTRVLFALSGNNIVAAIAASKLFNLLVLLVALWLWRQLSEDRRFGATVPAAALLFVWNPLVLFEGLSSAHNDLVMAACLLGAYVYWVRERWLGFAALWTLSVWYKWYSLLLGPVFLFWWCKQFGRTRWLIHGIGMAAVVIGVSSLSLVPYGDVAYTILRKPWDIKIGSSLFPTELPPTLWPLFWFTLESGWFEVHVGRQLFDLARYITAGILAVAWFFRRRRAEPRPEFVAQDCFVVLLILHAFLVPVLWPWHLLPAVVFGLLAGDKRLVAVTAAITVIAVLSYFLTFSVATLAVLLAGASVWVMRRATAERESATKARDI